MKIRTYITIILLILVGGGVFAMWGEAPIWAQSERTSTPTTVIPNEAIRLRILANSDKMEDQWIKRKVRDAMIEEMNKWSQEPQDIHGARQMIQDRLPQFQQIAEQTLAKHGFGDEVKVDFGNVPFPTKLYGNQVYPAGEYEALRVTIGAGEGDNWWCVLFPPLCFIDMSNSIAVTHINKA